MMKNMLILLLTLGACALDHSEPTPLAEEKRPPPPPPGPTCTADTDLTSDPTNCGTCGTICNSALCYSGVCADAVAGHVFVIGNGYGTSNPALDRLLGNAVFLNDRAQIRILAYSAYTPAVQVSGPNAAIDREAARRGRTTVKTITTNSADIQVLIGGADVFLVYAQPSADSQSLYFLGDEWSIPVDNFLRSGGVMVVLDTPSSNLGTTEVLRRPGLMDLSGRELAGPIGYITDPRDVVAARVPMVLNIISSVAWPLSVVDAATYMVGSSEGGGFANVLHRAIY